MTLLNPPNHASPNLAPLTTAGSPVSVGPRLVGEVVYLYAYDIAYELKRYPKPNLLGQPVATFSVDSSKRSPRQLFFYRPQMVRLPPVEKLTEQGMIRFHSTVKLMEVGAISVTIRVPFDVADISELVAYHDLRFSDGRSIHDEARALAEQVRQEILPYLQRPRPGLSDEEAYTVFCLHTPDNGQPFDAESYLHQHRREIAAVLTEEQDRSLLSEQECMESTHQWLAYSRQDLAVLDWDAALVVDDPKQFDSTLYVIELANLQLTELEAYDRLLDEVVDRAYTDVAGGRIRQWGGRWTQRELRVIRVDLAKMVDEMGNISKFFGDYHAGRLYQSLATRFHLADWQRTIDHKMSTLDHIYQLLTSDRMNLWMLLLEATIVFLILFDIVKAMFHWQT